MTSAELDALIARLRKPRTNKRAELEAAAALERAAEANHEHINSWKAKVQECKDLRAALERFQKMQPEALEAEVACLRYALRVIAGDVQGADSLMSDKEFARAALYRFPIGEDKCS